MSYFCLCICIWYEPIIVIETLSILVFSTLGLIVYSLKAKNDYTFLGFFLFAVCFSIPLAAICYIWTQNIFVLLCVVVGIVLYNLFIIYDIQTVLEKLGDKFKYDDYVLIGLKCYLTLFI